jgi:hypothetical protein
VWQSAAVSEPKRALFMSIDPNLEHLTWTVLLPIIPAVFVFIALPRHESQAEVKGPLGGMEVKFGGAAGLYLCILYLILNSPLSKPMTEDEVWTITGTIDTASPLVPEDIHSKLWPPTFHVNPDKTFDGTFPVGWRNGKRSFPVAITLEREPQPGINFDGFTIRLDTSEPSKYENECTLEPHQEDHEMKIKGSIPLRISHPFQPTGPTPSPTSPPS